ncbi:MAG: hypothetical protein ACYC5M_16960 [Anaerolineae bacterium]
MAATSRPRNLKDLRTRLAIPGRVGKLLGIGLLLPLLLAAFVVLGVRFSLNVPPFEAPDETWSFSYVRYLVEHRSLPDLSNEPVSPARAGMHQPPFYYAVGGLLTSGIWLDPDTPVYELNPYAALGAPHAPANKNAVLHLPDAERTNHAGLLALRLLRWLSLLCAAVTVYLSYCIALEIVGGRVAVALGVAALTALNPQFLFTGTSATSLSMLVMLCTLALYLAVRVAAGRAVGLRHAALLGVVCGLASLTAVSALAVFVVVPAAFAVQALSWRPRRLGRELFAPVGVALGVMTAVCGWWYLRNVLMFGSLLGPIELAARSADGTPSLALHQVVRALLDAVPSYWGVFGWLNVLMSESYYTFVRILTALAGIGLLLRLARLHWTKLSWRAYPWQVASVVVLWAVTVLLVVARRVLVTGGIRGDMFFPAIACYSLAIQIGVMGWVTQRYRWVGSVGAAAVLLVVSITAPVRYIAAAYQTPQAISLEQVPAGVRDLDIAYGEELFLLGYQLGENDVQVGRELRLQLYWLARKAMTQDYVVSVQVLGREGELIGETDTYPGGGAAPTRSWLPGDVFRDEYVIPIRRDARAPVGASIRVGVHTGARESFVSAIDAMGQEIGPQPAIARVRVAPRLGMPHFDPLERVQVNLGDQVLLAGYSLDAANATAGGALRLTLLWQPSTHLADDYTVFVHLLDKEGEIATQLDEQPLAGDYPTYMWQIDEQIQDQHVLVLPTDLQAGTYRVRVGLYVLETGYRLPIIGSEPAEDAIELGAIEITPG